MSEKRCKFCQSEKLVHNYEGFCYFNTQLENLPKLENGYPHDYKVYTCIDCGRNTVIAFHKGQRAIVE